MLFVVMSFSDKVMVVIWGDDHKAMFRSCPDVIFFSSELYCEVFRKCFLATRGHWISHTCFSLLDYFKRKLDFNNQNTEENKTTIGEHRLKSLSSGPFCFV